MLSVPDKNTARIIFDEAVTKNENDNPVFNLNTWIKHSFLVAETASKIAKETQDMDENAAYVVGLLHDVGKRWSEENGKSFHGITGYRLLETMGYDFAAQICLTHTFITLPVTVENYGYEKNLLADANQLLKGYVYNDYDLLIQLCDWLNKGGSYYTLEQRAKIITQSYPVNKEKVYKNYERALELKHYFENKTSIKDLYQFFGIKE